MIGRTASIGVMTLVLVLAACAPARDTASPTPTPARTAPTVAPFPIAAFAAIDSNAVNKELAAELQAALAQHDVRGGGGMSATVLTPAGIWSGTTGKADGVRDLRVDDQFSIASITKSVVAAQVMLMVEAGELALDDPVADHLPSDLNFDTNGATVRHLLSHRSGMPDYYDLLAERQQTQPRRAWTPEEILKLLPTWRVPAGSTFAYAETNYLLLRLMIEHVRGRPLAEVLRRDVLAIDGVERLVYQPDERPTAPLAVPAGAPRAVVKAAGGYLPSRAAVTAYEVMASDAPSLARWWQALCDGTIVSEVSLAEMSALQPVPNIGSYGLGLSNPSRGYVDAFGHTGQLPGFMSWAACLPEHSAVIVVLTNHEVADGHLAYSHGLGRPLIDALAAR